jgi:hypothetical protein
MDASEKIGAAATAFVEVIERYGLTQSEAYWALLCAFPAFLPENTVIAAVGRTTVADWERERSEKRGRARKAAMTRARQRAR